MFWIIGGAYLIRDIDKFFQTPFTKVLQSETHHVQWEGFVYYDLIFALFLFIAGVTIPISIKSKQQKNISSKKIHTQLFLRCLMLIFLGTIYNMGSNFTNYQNLRYASVLGLIGISSYIAAIFSLHTKIKTQILTFFSIIISYYLLIKFYPVPIHGPGNLDPVKSFPAYIDSILTPGRLHGGSYDPEGLTCAISAIATALAGVITGEYLLKTKISKIKKAITLIIAGFICLAIGHLWSYDYPIIKKMWSGTFVLVAAGHSLIFLSIFYTLFDILKPKIKNKILAFPLTAFGYFFATIGLNSITIYLVYNALQPEIFAITNLFFNPILVHAQQQNQSLHDIYLRSFALILEWLFLLYLVRKKIFLRV